MTSIPPGTPGEPLAGLGEAHAADIDGATDASSSKVTIEEAEVTLGELVALEAPAFTKRRWLGYDRHQVDAYVNWLREGLTRVPAPLGAYEIDDARFQVRRIRTSYDMREVDVYLDRVAGALRRHQSVGPLGDIVGQRSQAGHHRATLVWMAVGLTVAVAAVLLAVLS